MKFTVLLAGAALLSAACFTAEARRVPEPEAIDPSEASASTTQVVASDYHYDISTHSAKAGAIDFVVRNVAGEQHELMIVPHAGGNGDRRGGYARAERTRGA